MLIFEESTQNPPATQATGAGLSAPTKEAVKKKSDEIIKKVIERDTRDTKFKLL